MWYAKKASLVIDERGKEGVSHADEGGSICRTRTRQENLGCFIARYCKNTKGNDAKLNK